MTAVDLLPSAWMQAVETTPMQLSASSGRRLARGIEPPFGAGFLGEFVRAMEPARLLVFLREREAGLQCGAIGRKRGVPRAGGRRGAKSAWRQGRE